MRIEYQNDHLFMIYLNKFYLKEVEFQNKIDLELYFKSFFLKLKKYYHIKMEGFYMIDVYKDSFYGMILKIKKEDFDYFDEDMIDMKIRVKETNFLYQLKEECFYRTLVSHGSFYQNKHQIYYKLEENVSGVLLGMLEEATTLIIDTDDILEHAKELKKKQILTLL